MPELGESPIGSKFEAVLRDYPTLKYQLRTYLVKKIKSLVEDMDIRISASAKVVSIEDITNSLGDTGAKEKIASLLNLVRLKLDMLISTLTDHSNQEYSCNLSGGEQNEVKKLVTECKNAINKIGTSGVDIISAIISISTQLDVLEAYLQAILNDGEFSLLDCLVVPKPNPQTIATDVVCETKFLDDESIFRLLCLTDSREIPSAYPYIRLLDKLKTSLQGDILPLSREGGEKLLNHFNAGQVAIAEKSLQREPMYDVSDCKNWIPTALIYISEILIPMWQIGQSAYMLNDEPCLVGNDSSVTDSWFVKNGGDYMGVRRVGTVPGIPVHNLHEVAGIVSSSCISGEDLAEADTAAMLVKYIKTAPDIVILMLAAYHASGNHSLTLTHAYASEYKRAS